jgi:pimeloyl-ACP methyl ester carboxylesterase
MWTNLRPATTRYGGELSDAKQDSSISAKRRCSVLVGSAIIRQTHITYTNTEALMDTKTGLLPVPGAKLFYKVTGSGPLLLIIQGGDGDADGTRSLVEHLAAHYTVVTYDPRGLSRSVLELPPSEPWLETHVDDAYHLLAALGSAPALVFGTSRGALVGLALVARYPERARLLVAHEPPAVQLLQPDEQARAHAESEEIESTFQREGVAAAMRRFAAVAGMDFREREPDVELPKANPARITNLTFFLTYDAPAIHRYRLNLDGVVAAATRIIPAVGQRSRGYVGSQCALELAARIGVEVVEFPGAHSGFLTHPRAFASTLHQLLSGFVTSGSHSVAAANNAQNG